MVVGQPRNNAKANINYFINKLSVSMHLGKAFAHTIPNIITGWGNYNETVY
jgi:hypothetical protein